MYTVDSLGVMIDLSRNGVMTLDSLKKFLTTIKKFGYNTVFLYMEDTFEIKDEPYFGYMRSRYSCDEMREIDTFCSSIGIEAISDIKRVETSSPTSSSPSCRLPIRRITIVRMI